MAIPKFETGGILPSGIHDCDLTEIADSLVYNRQRETVWNSFLLYLSQVIEIAEVDTIYIDGSFVTDKESYADNNEAPNDVDIVLELADFQTLNLLVLQYPSLLNHDHIKQNFNVDLWFWTVGYQNDLREFFQYLRTEEAMNRNVPAGTKKGILRIQLNRERERYLDFVYTLFFGEV